MITTDKRWAGARACTCSWLLLATLVAGGCDAGFEARSIVIDLRTLALTMDPPEVVADFDPMNPQGLVIPETAVTALVADPGSDRRLNWAMQLCAPTDSLRCDDPTATIIPVAEGVAEDPESAAGADVSATFTPTLQLLEESVRLDELAGFAGVGVGLSLEVWPETGTRGPDSVFAAKKMIYAARRPAERVANQNPSFGELTATIDDVEQPFAPGRCADPGTQPLVVAPDTRVRLEPVEPDGIREDYVLPTFDNDVVMLTENMRYAWFATAGSFSDERTGGPTDPFGNVPPLRSFWTAPAADVAAGLPGGLVQLWVVQRDDRGGASWNEFCVQVGN